jgi:hypothetical protein
VKAKDADAVLQACGVPLVADRPSAPRRPSTRPPISPAIAKIALAYVRLSASRVAPAASIETLDAIADRAMALVAGRGVRRVEWVVTWWRGAYVLTRLSQGATISQAGEELQAVEEHAHPLSERALKFAMARARERERTLDGAGWPNGDWHEVGARQRRQAGERARGAEAYEAALERAVAEEDWRRHPQDAVAFLHAFPEFADDGEIPLTFGFEYDDQALTTRGGSWE